MKNNENFQTSETQYESWKIWSTQTHQRFSKNSAFCNCSKRFEKVQLIIPQGVNVFQSDPKDKSPVSGKCHG